MKDYVKRLWREYKKPVIAGVVILFAAVGTFYYVNSNPNATLKDEKSYATNTDIEKYEEKAQIKDEVIEMEAMASEATEQNTSIEKDENDSREDIVDNVEDKINGNANFTDVGTDNKDREEISSGEQKPMAQAEAASTPKPTPKPTPTPTTKPIVDPEKKEIYVPISEGWKASESARGNISSEQKIDLDRMIEDWKKGQVTDLELQLQIMKYLEEQGIEYMEVSVTSKGYALYDEIPTVDLRNGGNLYSFVGIYCIGKQNPDLTNKTVCYNWSAFIF